MPTPDPPSKSVIRSSTSVVCVCVCVCVIVDLVQTSESQGLSSRWSLVG